MTGFGLARSLLAFSVASVLAATLGGTETRAADRSVTILEGVDEPPPVAQPLPPGVAAPPSLQAQNPAGVAVTILPNSNPPLGSRIALAVSTQQPGYLILVDLNADGKLTQIYPNMMSLSRTSSDVSSANLIKPGTTVTIPDRKNPLARFVFTADAPRGAGAIVAIVSDRPVQLIDLPDLPASVQGSQAVLDALYTAVAGLKIASSDEAGTFKEGVWSFAAAPYQIQ